MKAIAIVSGGMDSVAMLHRMFEEKTNEILVLSFNYGQRHSRELIHAEAAAERFGLRHEHLSLIGVGELLARSGSSLISNTPVPEGHYAEDSMKNTVVPNRNMIMLSIAVGVAVAEKASLIGLGVHAGDHYVYPDCRFQFIHTFKETVRVANEGFIAKDFNVWTPWMYNTKDQIVKYAEHNNLNVPWKDTWSCYKGLEKHCGKCGTCVERKEAFQLSNIEDPTEYSC